MSDKTISEIREEIDRLKKLEKEIMSFDMDKEKRERQAYLLDLFENAEYVICLDVDYGTSIKGIRAFKIEGASASDVEYISKYCVTLHVLQEAALYPQYATFIEEFDKASCGANHRVHEAFDFMGRQSRIYYPITKVQFDNIVKASKKHKKVHTKLNEFFKSFTHVTSCDQREEK